MKSLIVSSKPSRVIIFILVLITAIGIYLRVEQRAKSEIWDDEQTQIRKSKIVNTESFFEWTKKVNTIEVLFGDYLLTRPLANKYGTNKWVMALPHYFTTLLAFFLLYYLCRAYYKTIVGYLICFIIFAFNNTLIFHALEIRPYSSLIALNLATFLILKHIVENKNLPKKKIVFFSLSLIITITFHLYSIFMITFSYAFHLLFSRKGELLLDVIKRNIRQFGVIVLLSFAIWGYYVSIYDTGRFIDGPKLTFLFMPNDPIGMSKSVLANMIGTRLFYFFLLGLFIPYALPLKNRIQQITFFYLVIVLPVSVLLYLAVKTNYYFTPRHFSWIIPLFIFQIAWHWDSLAHYFFNKNGT